MQKNFAHLWRKKMYSSLWNYILTLFTKYVEHRIGQQISKKSKISNLNIPNLEISSLEMHLGNAHGLLVGNALSLLPAAFGSYSTLSVMCHF